MSTKDVLSRAVLIAGEEVTPQIGTIEELVADIEALAPELRTTEEKQILEVARATKESLPLINLASAIKAGGVRPDGFPNLAVASYVVSFNKEMVETTLYKNGGLVFQDTADWRKKWQHEWQCTFPAGTLLPPPNNGFFFSGPNYPLCGSASVPTVPTFLRQKDVRDVVLLFEVAEWNKLAPIPTDPYLLRRIAGYVYAILGSWDITERELKAYQAARDLGV